MTDQNNAAQATHIEALQDLRVGVEMDRHHLPDGDAKLAALDAAISLLRAPVADETYTDDNGTVWTRPTAWAYAQVCKALDKWRAAASALVAGEAQPVAWMVYASDTHQLKRIVTTDPGDTAAFGCLKMPLYAAPQASDYKVAVLPDAPSLSLAMNVAPQASAEGVRNAALEEAAQALDRLHAENRRWHNEFREAAAVVRALKQPQADKGGGLSPQSAAIRNSLIAEPSEDGSANG